MPMRGTDVWVTGRGEGEVKMYCTVPVAVIRSAYVRLAGLDDGGW